MKSKIARQASAATAAFVCAVRGILPSYRTSPASFKLLHYRINPIFALLQAYVVEQGVATGMTQEVADEYDPSLPARALPAHPWRVRSGRRHHARGDRPPRAPAGRPERGRPDVARHFTGPCPPTRSGVAGPHHRHRALDDGHRLGAKGLDSGRPG